MPDWIQPEDQAFHIQNNALRTWLGVLANTTPTGLNSNEINDLLNAGTAWDTAYAAKTAHDLAAPPFTTAKTSARADLESLMRPIAKVLRAKHQSGLLTDVQMVAAGIPLLDTTQTPSSAPSA